MLLLLSTEHAPHLFVYHKEDTVVDSISEHHSMPVLVRQAECCYHNKLDKRHQQSFFLSLSYMTAARWHTVISVMYYKVRQLGLCALLCTCAVNSRYIACYLL
jgi:hypothetical protein